MFLTAFLQYLFNTSKCTPFIRCLGTRSILASKTGNLPNTERYFFSPLFRSFCDFFFSFFFFSYMYTHINCTQLSNSLYSSRRNSYCRGYIFQTSELTFLLMVKYPLCNIPQPPFFFYYRPFSA